MLNANIISYTVYYLWQKYDTTQLTILARQEIILRRDEFILAQLKDTAVSNIIFSKQTRQANFEKYERLQPIKNTYISFEMMLNPQIIIPIIQITIENQEIKNTEQREIHKQPTKNWNEQTFSRLYSQQVLRKNLKKILLLKLLTIYHSILFGYEAKRQVHKESCQKQ
ncbi:hypothetical protein ABPG72_005488 [Tetrahymena utriculariae]